MDSSWLQYADPTEARDLTIDAAQALGKALKGGGSSSRNIPFQKLKALLDSRSDRDILDGMKRVISMMYQNTPCLPYFSSVVKNVANPNLEVKKLVYIYLLHYAESDPDLALLSVNAIQKSLTDQNPQIRALALRTMAGMRVPVISQIVSLAIKRGAGDMSPHVRKAAALAIPKCYNLDPNTLPQLLDYLSVLLGDKQYFVVGPAVQSFLELCPERIDLIHKHYRSLTKKLVDMDEWSQLATLRLLLFYGRRSFPQRTQRVTKVNKKGFYEDEADQTVETDEVVQVLDPDLELFLNACRPLLSSRSPAVIVSIVSCFLYLGTRTYLEEAVGPLIGLLRGPTEVEEVALCNIVLVSLTAPELFVPYASHFLLRALDSPQMCKLKIELLTLIYPHAALHLKSIILSELQHFSHSSDIGLIRESVRAIGRCAQSDPNNAHRCFRVLLNQISSFDNVLVSEVLTVMRHLIQQDPKSHRKTVVRLARNLDKTTSPEARATIIWLVGEFASLDPDNDIAPDVLRILAKGFAEESETAKQQIVLLAAKVYLLFLQKQRSEDDGDASQDNGGDHVQSTSLDHLITKLWDYIQLLARYDTSYDLRDRARLFKALLANSQSTQLAALLLLAPKPVPHSPSPSESRKGLLLGSTTLVLGKDVAGVLGLPGYQELPEWVSDGLEPDPKLRNGDGGEKEEYVPLAARTTASVSASKRLAEAVKERGLEDVVAAGSTKTAKPRTLDDWLAESEGEEEETEEETESGESGEESEEEETDAESEDDEEKESRRGLIS
ncbi:adaptin N terminal region-domain-containing protein [Exophiala viscosa]|uniref:Adaptin N terminal region-domain-containing protein n=1 Tax=Exophiala viscosa TaxID=2486360 RepID=A0AAN6DR30_9EURO|nr:adaptin N terminal region-domain-containing protein [Exophiala viscosa]